MIVTSPVWLYRINDILPEATRAVFSFSSAAQKALRQLASPEFRGGQLVSPNLVPLLVGSSSCGQVIFGGGQIETWTQYSGNKSPVSQEMLTLPGGSMARRRFLEGMVVQAATGLFGVVVDHRNEKIGVDFDNVPPGAADQVQADFDRIFNQRPSPGFEESWRILERYAMPPAYCAGLNEFLARGFGTPDQAAAVKGQQTGVVTLGMDLLTPGGERAISHPNYLTLAMAVMLRGEWQRVLLTEHTGNPNTVIFNDEPGLMKAWSGAGGVDEETLASLLRLQQEANQAGILKKLRFVSVSTPLD